MEIREIRGNREVRDVKDVRDVKEPESLPKARKPSLNSLISLNSFSPHPKARKHSASNKFQPVENKKNPKTLVNQIKISIFALGIGNKNT